MPSMQEIELQSKVLVELLKPMAKQLSELNSQVTSLGKQLHEVRQEYELFKSQQKSIDVDEIATAAAAKIVVKDGADGADGQSVSIDDVLPVLLPELKNYAQELVSAIPAPKDGRDGMDGVDGKSVNVDDVLDSLKEQVIPVLKDHAAELVSAIPVPEPIHGRDGKDGKDGIDGKSIEVKDIEPIINELVKKAADSLPPPKNGIDGKDATDITILPEIDFSKNYPRGVWAHHKGGLWKSHSATNGERGWDCIVNGVESVNVEKHSERDISIVITQSNGETIEKSFYQPALIYKGIYDEKRDKEYVEGDTVTCGGSVWYCKCDNPGRPSNENRNWQLAVKHGQHGKDGRNGIDYTKPVTVGSS